mmetsp:Transcript_13850/g.41819  ORF Transcript_13850/g.41819 Transcript_13850/m.41819 type:complete len:203 (+) Transcript_13850:1623-2231(+)
MYSACVSMDRGVKKLLRTSTSSSGMYPPSIIFCPRVAVPAELLLLASRSPPASGSISGERPRCSCVSSDTLAGCRAISSHSGTRGDGSCPFMPAAEGTAHMSAHSMVPEEGATRRSLASLSVRGARSCDQPTTAATSLATSARAAARSLTTFTCSRSCLTRSDTVRSDRPARCKSRDSAFSGKPSVLNATPSASRGDSPMPI